MLFGSLSLLAALPLTEWCTERSGRKGHGLEDNHALTARLKASPAGLVVDVGAFDGGDTIRFATNGGHRVWTFEPAPTKVGPIKQRFIDEGIDSRVTLHNVALSNASGTASFRMYKMTYKPTQKKLYGKFERMMSKSVGSAFDTLNVDQKGVPRADSEMVQVPVSTLDSFDPDGKAEVLFMKVDAQGYDYRVLRGAEKMLRSQRIRGLVFEYCPHCMPTAHTPLGKTEAREALHWLTRVGYSCAPCNMNPWRFKLLAGGAVKHSIHSYVATFFKNALENVTDYFGFFDNFACEPTRLCEEAGRPDCKLWVHGKSYSGAGR